MPNAPQPLAADLARAQSPADFHHALRAALGRVDQLGAQTVAASGVKLACCAGCGLCCTLRVDVFAHEVFLVADHIRTHFSAAERAALTVRLAAHAEKVRPLTPFEHATQNVTCPLLRDSRCSVYAARPHTCRRHHSQDFAACQFTYDHPTDLDFPGAHDRALFRTLTEAMRQGAEVYAQLGYDATIYELGTALAEALASPASWRRWRAQKKAFRHASETPAE